MRGFLILILLLLLVGENYWVWNHCPQARREVSRILNKVGITLESESRRILPGPSH